jgi:DNA-binding CsgD family transcriptional regulator
MESLIDDIYATVVRPDLWPAVLQKVTAATGSRDCVVHTVHKTSAIPTENSLLSVDGSRFLHDHYSQHPEISDSRTAIAFLTKEGLIFDDSSFLSFQAMNRDPFYQEVLRPIDYWFVSALIVANTRVHETHLLAGVALQRSKAQGPIEGASRESWEFLAPHLGRAVRLGLRFNNLYDDSDIGSPFGLEITECGFDARGKIVAGDGVLDDWQAVGICDKDPHGCLRFRDRRVHQLFDHCMRRAQRNAASYDTSGSCEGPDATWSVAFTSGNHDAWEHLPHLSQCTLIARIQRAPMPAPRPHLSPAEDRLLHHLVEGLSLRGAADQLGVSYETVRSQCKSAMAKLGAHSRTELVLSWRDATKRKRPSLRNIAPATRHSKAKR